MENKLLDKHMELHDILFDTLTRITNKNLDGEVFEKEVKRARIICDLAEYSVKNGMFMAALYRLNDSTAGMKQATKLLG